VLQIKTDDRDVGAIHDGAVVFQATMRGPLAEKPMIGGVKATSTVDEIMLGFVDGIPPKGAEYLPCTPEFDGVGVWEYEGQLYVRTRHAAVWPAWTMVANGTGDIRVYKMPVVPSIILSKGGATHTLNIIQEGQNG
jgi:intracellular multiplication protein IcmK